MCPFRFISIFSFDLITELVQQLLHHDRQPFSSSFRVISFVESIFRSRAVRLNFEHNFDKSENFPSISRSISGFNQIAFFIYLFFVFIFFFLGTHRDEVITRSKMLEEEAKRKATEDEQDDTSDNDNNHNSDESGLDDDVFYDSDGNDQEAE